MYAEKMQPVRTMTGLTRAPVTVDILEMDVPA